MSYQTFLARKEQKANDYGFAPVFMPDFLFDFQRHLVEWAVRKGRSAIFADCGLGKTPMQLVWAQNIVLKMDKPVLIIAPLAVSPQTVSEAQKFGMDAEYSRDGHYSTRIVVTNYERLHYFNPSDFAGCVCDESSILKNVTGARRTEITDVMRRIEYRLLCTATAAPNDYFELGTSSDALGYLGARDMLTKFFKEDVSKDYLGWGRKSYRFRGHAEEPFWQWVASWARACRKPSDLGFSDAKFVLPRLIESEEVVKNSTPRDGMLFALPARDIREQREERRITLNERCELAAVIANNHNGASVVWCHLNDEADALELAIDGAEQVSGDMSEESKEAKLTAFKRGDIRVLVTKPKIGCFGLNWQHCHNVITFPSHSWEQYYQAVRRCWRFGQQNPVTVHIITTEGERGVMANLQRKAKQADAMFTSLVAHMNEAMSLDRGLNLNQNERTPSWL